jgi:hypothetical protein
VTGRKVLLEKPRCLFGQQGKTSVERMNDVIVT